MSSFLQKSKIFYIIISKGPAYKYSYYKNHYSYRKPITAPCMALALDHLRLQIFRQTVIANTVIQIFSHFLAVTVFVAPKNRKFPYVKVTGVSLAAIEICTTPRFKVRITFPVCKTRLFCVFNFLRITVATFGFGSSFFTYHRWWAVFNFKVICF